MSGPEERELPDFINTLTYIRNAKRTAEKRTAEKRDPSREMIIWWGELQARVYEALEIFLTDIKNDR